MSTATVAILGTRYQDLAIEEAILEPLGVRLVAGAGRDGADILAAADGADVILAGAAPRFDAGVIERLSCRGIVRYGVGTDSIDLAAAERAGIWVARVSDYGTEAVAIHAVTLILAGLRRLREADARVRAGGWGFGELRPLHLPSATTAGVIGFGRIGARVGRQLAALGFRVLAHDPYVSVTEAAGGAAVTSATFDQVLADSDVVSLHVPGASDGRPLLDAAALARMKAGSVLVNTARGSLVDAAALVRGMGADRPRIAALDVYHPEPPDVGEFSAVADRLILTPHMAWYTEQSEVDLRTKAAEEAARLVRGEPPLDVVVAPRAAAEGNRR
ncbi:MAG: C-terminal binding protein [Streptosporangiales bacterium]|nr:C-terminal binding protein [Streptosporangiales bacterium]